MAENNFEEPRMANGVDEREERDDDWIDVTDAHFHLGSDDIADKEENSEDDGVQDVPIKHMSLTDNYVESVPESSTLNLPQPPQRRKLDEEKRENNHETKEPADESKQSLENQVEILSQGISYLHSLLLGNAKVTQLVKSANSNASTAGESAPDCTNLPLLLSTQLSDVMAITRTLCNVVEEREKHPRIAFMDFKIGDVALFMPAFVQDRKIWMAFNSGSPNFFLSDDSLLVFFSKSRNKDQRTSIIGRIVYMEKKTSTTTNPYRIPAGVEYHVCYAEPLYRHEFASKSNTSSKPISPPLPPKSPLIPSSSSSK